MKETRIYLNGSYYYVQQPNNNERFTIYHLSGKKAVRIAGADSLYEAVRDYDNTRNNRDDVFNCFEAAYADQLKAIEHMEDDNKYNDLVERLYNEFLNNLTGDQYFDIVRDGSYHAYIDWNNVDEEEGEDF